MHKRKRANQENRVGTDRKAYYKGQTAETLMDIIYLSALDFDQVVDRYHLALGELSNGNPEPVKALFSHRGDVSAASGFGGVMQSWEQVSKNTEFADHKTQASHTSKHL